MIENLLIFIAAIMVLITSGSIMVKSLSKIAAFLRLSEYVIGFIILAFATSLPELFVGISSAINKTPSIVLGTVIGANIANLTYIIGIPVLLARGIKIQSKKTKKDSLWMIGLATLPLILMLIGSSISRIDGVILLFAFSLYVYKLLKESREFSKEIENRIGRKEIVIAVSLFIFSLVLLYFSSDIVVKYAQILAVEFSIPAIFIGLFMISIGTSLPELVSGITAVLNGHNEMGVGNVMGSVIANSTIVLGVSALIFPITAAFLLFIVSISFMLVVAIIFTTFVEKGNKLSWMEGVSLLLLYIFFLIVEFYIKGYLA
jgi:cation:H+ antiporter